jgi:integrase
MASIHRKRRSPFWQAYWRDEHGHPHCRSTKQRSRKEAQRIADLLELTAKRKKSAAHIRSVFSEVFREAYGSELPSITLRDYAEQWLADKRVEAAPASLRSYYTTIKHFTAHLGERADQDIALLSRQDIVAWRNSVASRLYHVTANRHLKTLRSMFRAAKRDGYLLDNPIEEVASVSERASASDFGRRPFSLPEIQAVLSVADPEWQSLIRFGFYTGQRLTDIALLSWHAIDLGRDEIRFITRKTAKRVTIPICAALREHILSLPTPDTPGAPIHQRSKQTITRQGYSSTLSQQFAALLVQAGLRADTTSHRSRGIGRSNRRKREELSFHSLRHSATSILHELGVPVSVVQTLIGHDSVTSHQNYVGVGMDAVRAAAAKLPAI